MFDKNIVSIYILIFLLLLKISIYHKYILFVYTNNKKYKNTIPNNSHHTNGLDTSNTCFLQ